MQPIAPRCGCDSGVGYDLRKWRVVDAIDFGPWRNAGESVPAAAHSLRDFQRDIVRWRAGSLLTLGFSTALCGMVQVHRRPTCGGRVNPGYGDPDRRTSVVQLRAMARRRGQLADLGYPVTPVLAHMVAEHVTIARRLSDVGTKRIVLVSRCSGPTSISHLNFACSGCMRGVHHRGELCAVRTSARWSMRSIFNHRSCAGCRSQIPRVPERHDVTRG
jgi:hypothetical protein